MKGTAAYRQAFALVNTMSQDERVAFIKEIMDAMKIPGADKVGMKRCDSIIAEVSPERPDCPHCKAKASLGFIIKKGMHNGSRRFGCKVCGKKFVATTNTVFSRTRKDADTWYKFIEMTITGKSLAACAEECGICHQTAFNWRHKVLHAFVVNQRGIKLTGRVEMDDTFYSVSYKGNHVKGGFGKRTLGPGEDNGLPRASYRRGSDNKSNVRQKVCVMCMVQDKNKVFYAAVPGIGPANPAMLDATVGKNVDKAKARMLSDTASDNIRYFEQHGYDFRALSSNVSDNKNDHKPEVVAGEHIQNVNNFHRRLRRFIGGYCGVSTKYLENYTALFAWLDNIKATKQRNSVQKVSTSRAAAHDCYITSKEIYARPAVPACA